MHARVKWLDHMSFVGESGSGHAVVMDAATEVGGRNLGIRPMEMVLLGLGGCTAFDVVSILQKAHQPVRDCEVLLTAERAEQTPKVFIHIDMLYRIYGDGLSERRVAKAVSLSAEKYCSVTRMLEHSAKIQHRYEIITEQSSS